MAGKFEVYKDRKGEFRFRLKASNGQNILASEGYRTRASCLKGIESVRRNSQNPERLVVKAGRGGKSSFHVTATNGQTVGTSQSYKSESGRRNGMRSVARNAAEATVEDLT